MSEMRHTDEKLTREKLGDLLEGTRKAMTEMVLVRALGLLEKAIALNEELVTQDKKVLRCAMRWLQEHGTTADPDDPKHVAIWQQNIELFAVLDELETSFDRQTLQEKKDDDYDAPDDREYSVNITAKQLRAISAAIAGARG